MIRIALLAALAALGGCSGIGGVSTAKVNVVDVPQGTTLPFGEVARVCDVKGNDLGRELPETAARGYRLYDSRPGGSGPRAFYITGFADGCPRQLTAANVLFATPSTYERLHYGPGGENLPRAGTDAAYEKIKAQVCGTGRGKPCGRRLSRLDRSTFFVSAYRRLGETTRWTEALVHDGTVAAVAMKSAR